VPVHRSLIAMSGRVAQVPAEVSRTIEDGWPRCLAFGHLGERRRWCCGGLSPDGAYCQLEAPCPTFTVHRRPHAQPQKTIEKLHFSHRKHLFLPSIFRISTTKQTIYSNIQPQNRPSVFHGETVKPFLTDLLSIIYTTPLHGNTQTVNL